MKYLTTLFLLSQVMLLTGCENGGGSSVVPGLSCVYEGEQESSCVNINPNYGTDAEIKQTCEVDLGVFSNTECPKVLNGVSSGGLCVELLVDESSESFLVSSRRYNNETLEQKEDNCERLNQDQWIAD